ncbi:MAG TPA: hypothetical protein VE842_03115, partial [Pyrinomonadaceae bacterium]|nr:hypothetical protein [Pyrinomonadaceae bacterium]
EGTFLYMNAGRYHVPFTGSYNFSPTSDGTAAPDTGFARASAAVAKVTDGASGDGSLTVANNVYGAGWNGSQQVPTRDDVFDKIETLAPLASPAFTGTPSAPALSITGTGGGGFLQLANQSSTPSTPTSAGRIYFDSANKFSWIGTNGFTRSFDGTANTANRVYTLPDADSKFPILSQFLTFTGPTAARTFALPDVSTTLCGTNAVCTGYGATANPLSQFASTTSAQLAGVLSDETGSASPGVAMFSNSPTVKAGTSANTTFTIDTTSASQAASIVFSEAGTAKASIQHNPSTLSGGFIIQAGGIASPANTRFAISATGNIGINTTSAFGGGAGVLGMLNATTAPTSTPTGGGIIWIEGGALKYKGSSGTVTTLANPYRTFSRFINPIRAKYGRFMFTK